MLPARERTLALLLLPSGEESLATAALADSAEKAHRCKPLKEDHHFCGVENGIVSRMPPICHPKESKSVQFAK